MNKKAFTLIELMIVVAIIGIIVTTFHLHPPFLIGSLNRNQEIIEENRSLTLAYGLIRNCIKDCRRIVSVSEGRILFDNDSYIAIENFGTLVRVNGKTLQLAGRASISEIEHINDDMFMTRVNTGMDVLQVLWKAGESFE